MLVSLPYPPFMSVTNVKMNDILPKDEQLLIYLVSFSFFHIFLSL